VLLGIAASAWIARGWDAAVTRQRDERLDHSATSRTTAIGEMLREYESALYAERSLWLASAFVSHKDFETFASSLDLSRRYPGLQGIGWRAFVPHEQADEFVADARRHGPADFTIRPAGKLPGNPILTERTIPASLLLGTGIAISVLLGTLLWLLAQVGTLYQRVGRMARTDPLTGVLNRRVLDQELPRELARAARGGQPLCVALIDLDRFKAYNDRHGHQAGDRLLKAVGAAWSANLRTTDLLVRYGGEEFAVVLPDCGLEDAMAIAERLRTAQPEGTCSIGVAEWARGETVDELIGRADQALYAAKAGGRDRCRASPSPPASRRRILEGSQGPSGLEAR